MDKLLRILHLEDARFDSDLIKRELNKSGILLEWLWAGNKKEFERGLKEFKPDIILSDYSLPSFSGEVAFDMAMTLAPEIPFIIVSGTIGDENAVKLIKNGVTDYASKNRLVALHPKIMRALKEAEVRKEKKAISETLNKVKNLYAFISQVNQNIVRVKDESTLFHNSCKMAIDFGKFKMAWIGIFDFENKKISLVEQCGVSEEDQPLFTNISYKPKGPQDCVLQTGSYFICNDIQRDLELVSWKPYCLNRGLKSAIVLPIKKSGKIIGTLNLYSTEVNFSGKEELRLLIELTNDISFALELFEKEKNQKTTEELIIKNEKQFRALIEQSEDMETLSDVNGTPFYASPSITTVLGYKLETFLNIPPCDLIHPADIAGVFENIQKISRTAGSSFYGLHRLKHQDGHWIWCEGTITNMLDEPHVNAIVSNFRDVSEKKIAEQKLAFDTNNLNALINNTNDLMWSVDTNFNLITSNAPFNEMAEKNFGKVIQTGENILHVSYSPEIYSHFEKIYQRVFDGETFTETTRFDIPNEFWSEISYLPIRYGNEIIGAACHSRDITERKNSENNLIKSAKQLNEAQQIALVGSWELNFEEDTALWSDEANRIYGIPINETRHSYETWLSFIHPEDLEMVKEETGRSQQTLKGSSIKHRILLKDGTVKHIHSITKLAFDDIGKPIGLIGVCHDITEGKQAEQNLAQEIRHSKKHQSMLLSSQINPHFIFNALNSVQYFILLKENTESALNFVADFSLLMRATLTNSRSEFIPIEDEIKFLELYLKLEKQRSSKKFNYVIITDNGIDPEDMYIPPMVIQPYLENAVIHGLDDNSDNNKIIIRFSKNNNHIRCKITDNGIGRQRAMEFKNQKNDLKHHESMGMKITETRIKLLNELYDDSFVVRVNDLTDNQGMPAGTEVEINLPILDEESIFGLD